MGEVQKADEATTLEGQKSGATVGMEQVLFEDFLFLVEGKAVVILIQEKGGPVFFLILHKHRRGHKGKARKQTAALDGIIQQPLEKPPGSDEGFLLGAPWHFTTAEVSF
jgi:hypothetical protein